MLGEVRFARAKVNGAPTSLLIEAHLDAAPSHVLADHATATVRVFQMVVNDVGIGTPDQFRFIGQTQTTKRYCNVELAMRDVIGLPLPSTYEGFNKVDGCSH